MRFSTLLVAAGVSLLLCLNARADWAQSSDPLVVKPNPADNQTQIQNPPGFTWARHPSEPAAYEVEILAKNASPPILATVERNWYLPTKALPIGEYTWRVRPANSTEWSAARRFTMTAGSTLFEVPDNATLRSRIMARARPRSLDASFVPMKDWGVGRNAEMEPFYSRLRNEVNTQIIKLPTLSDALWPLVIRSPLTQAMKDQLTCIREKINEAGRQLEAAAVLYRLAGNQLYLDEARRVGDQLVSLSPTGPTSDVNADQGNRQIAVSLARAVDLLAKDLGGPRKAQWLAAIEARAGQIHANLAAKRGRLDQWPLDSHGTTAHLFLTVISTLTLGDIPQAQRWFDFSFRAYANYLSPWSGPEGGYANGTGYAVDTAGYLVSLWDPLLHASGVNFYAKRWSVGFLDFIMQFLPPGARTHAFGDKYESKPEPRVLVALASRMTSPRAAWYVQALGGFEDALSRLQAPYPLPVTDTRFAGPPSNSAYYPGIGWTAMHSDIASRGRTSVYFKSSPYGSFNHSHGDQNGFLLSVAGQPLLIKAGRYLHDSPDWKNWYRQTKSQNAVTFDGGIGQVVEGYRETLAHNGQITFFTAQPGYDHAEGDATRAYGGKLTMAKRQLWYLRAENAVLIRDKLSASVPHVYEFNLHAPAAIAVEAPSKVTIAAGGQSVCVSSLGAGAAFEKRSGGIPAPGIMEDHGAFALRNDGTAPAEFIVLLDVGCKRPVATVTTEGTGPSQVRKVTIGTQSVTLN